MWPPPSPSVPGYTSPPAVRVSSLDRRPQDGLVFSAIPRLRYLPRRDAPRLRRNWLALPILFRPAAHFREFGTMIPYCGCNSGDARYISRSCRRDLAACQHRLNEETSAKD